MVGNGVTDEEFDGNALVPFAHGMGLISNDLFQVCNLPDQLTEQLFVLLVFIYEFTSAKVGQFIF